MMRRSHDWGRPAEHYRQGTGNRKIGEINMSALAISWIAFGCIFGGALLGMFLRSRLPEKHLNSDSKDVIKLAMGVLGTMAGLVLALLINSAKASHDVQSAEITQMAADFVLLDRVLAHYGPDTGSARELLRTALSSVVSTKGSVGSSRSVTLDSAATLSSSDSFFEKIQAMQPRDDFQRALHSQAIQICEELGRLRSTLLEQTHGTIPMPFLVVLIFWLTVIFTGFGLFAQPNATVIGVLFLRSLSIAGAIFLVLELDRPFEGLIQVSDLPLRNAIVHLGK
jgi:hypothetical protein